MNDCQDEFVWDLSVSGDLSFKEAFLFLNPIRNTAGWNKALWSKFIPLTRAFLVWRRYHSKMPTDENIRKIGCIIVSMSSLCENFEESSIHIFLHCPFAVNLWQWLGTIFNISINTSSVQELFMSLKNHWSSQMK